MRGGFLLVDKPAGLTSHDVVVRLRRALSARRVGHAGTLDKPARGLLLVAVGGATRLLRFLSEVDKSYRGTVVFGVSTDTDDSTGRVLAETACNFGSAELEEGIAGLTGVIFQRPPDISAVQVGGERLYRRARRGEAVSAPFRQVVISRLEVVEFLGGHRPQAVIEMDCSKGTYVRAVARDLGERLGCGAHLSGLVRLRIGRFTLDTATPLERLTEMAAAGEIHRVMLPPEAAVEDWPQVRLDEEGAAAVRKGTPLAAALPAHIEVPEGRPFALLAGEGELLAVAEIPAGQVGSGEPGWAGARYILVYSSDAGN